MGNKILLLLAGVHAAGCGLHMKGLQPLHTSPEEVFDSLAACHQAVFLSQKSPAEAELSDHRSDN